MQASTGGDETTDETTDERWRCEAGQKKQSKWGQTPTHLDEQRQVDVLALRLDTGGLLGAALLVLLQVDTHGW